MSAVHGILVRAEKAKIKDEPFPHLIVEDALPARYYAALESTYPDLDFVAGDVERPSNTLFLKSATEVIHEPRVAEIWRDFFAFHCSGDFFHQVRSLWAERIERLHPDVARNFGRPLADFTVGLRESGKHDNAVNRSSDIVLDCQFGTNTPVQRVSSVRGPHLDGGAKLFAALLYLRRADDQAGGDLELYRWKRRRPRGHVTKVDPALIECFERVAYEPNRLVMWLNSPDSIHGVSPRAITDAPRRYVNFLGECYAGRRQDFFTARRSGGFVRGVIDRMRSRSAADAEAS